MPVLPSKPTGVTKGSLRARKPVNDVQTETAATGPTARTLRPRNSTTQVEPETEPTGATARNLRPRRPIVQAQPAAEPAKKVVKKVVKKVTKKPSKNTQSKSSTDRKGKAKAASTTVPANPYAESGVTTGSASLRSLIDYYKASKPPIAPINSLVQKWIVGYEGACLLSKKNEDDLRKFLEYNKYSNHVFNKLRDKLRLENVVPNIEDTTTTIASPDEVDDLMAVPVLGRLLPLNEVRSGGGTGVDDRQAAYLLMLVDMCGKNRTARLMKEVVKELSMNQDLKLAHE